MQSYIYNKEINIMKKSIFTLVVVLSFTYVFGANQATVNSQKTLDAKIKAMPYIEEEEADEKFDFDYKSYLPKGFNAYDLSDSDISVTDWVEEEEEEEEEADAPFDFDHKQYLPVGFNPSSALNTLFLTDVKWVDEEEDATFDFDTKKYFYISNAKVIVTINF